MAPHDRNAAPVTDDEYAVQAAWVFADSEHCLAPGVVQVRQGRIVAVQKGSDSNAIDLGAVAIIPGLINSHTHLEFSSLTAPLAAEARFPNWIKAVVRWRRSRFGDGTVEVQQGWNESKQQGIAAVGEIATADETYSTLQAAGARGVVFREVIGLTPESSQSGLALAREYLQPQLEDSPLLTRGLSPHAPYTLRRDLFEALIQLAVDTAAPVAMHLAETREELELLSERRGGLVDLLSELQLWHPDNSGNARRPLDYLQPLGRCRRALVVHGNYLSREEIDWLAMQPHMTLAYCPRTHAAFGHTPHPWQQLLDQGGRVTIGTDSRASNPDLSILAELQWLHQHFPEFPVKSLLQMATERAAFALSLEDSLGSLAPGKIAAMTVLRPQTPISPDCWTGLFARGTIAIPDAISNAMKQPLSSGR